jgi:hypothetical protein
MPDAPSSVRTMPDKIRRRPHVWRTATCAPSGRTTCPARPAEPAIHRRRHRRRHRHDERSRDAHEYRWHLDEDPPGTDAVRLPAAGQVEFAGDRRAHQPVQLDIGPCSSTSARSCIRTAPRPGLPSQVIPGPSRHGRLNQPPAMHRRNIRGAAHRRLHPKAQHRGGLPHLSRTQHTRRPSEPTQPASCRAATMRWQEHANAANQVKPSLRGREPG